MLTFLEVSGVVHCASDIELSYTPGSKAVATFSVAANREWTGGDGNKKKDSCFIGCTAWGKTAEAINKAVGKGDPLYIEGTLKQDTWEKDGHRHTRHSVTITRVFFLKTKD